MPLVRRIPKRGFNNRWAAIVAIVNVGDLDEQFEAGDEVTPESLASKDLRQGPLRRAQSAGRRRADQEAEGLGPSASADRRWRRSRRPAAQAVVLPGKEPVVKNKMKAEEPADEVGIATAISVGSRLAPRICRARKP